MDLLRNHHDERGSAITEFGPALIVLISFVFLPLLNIASLPVYTLAATGALNQFTHSLALSETRRDAYTQLHNDTRWSDFLSRWGVRLHNPRLSLVICGRNEGDRLEVPESQPIPDNWLPGGAKGPCVYSIETSVEADLPPISRGCAGLPGFSSPLTITLRSRSQWENLGRDPNNGQFYVNEY